MVFNESVEYTFGKANIAISDNEHKSIAHFFEEFPFVSCIFYGSQSDTDHRISAYDERASAGATFYAPYQMELAKTALRTIARNRYGFDKYTATLMDDDGKEHIVEKDRNKGLKRAKGTTENNALAECIGCTAGGDVAMMATNPALRTQMMRRESPVKPTVVDYLQVTAASLQAKRAEKAKAGVLVHLPLVLEAISKANDAGMTDYKVCANVMFHSDEPNTPSHTFTNDELLTCIKPELEARQFKVDSQLRAVSPSYLEVSWN